LWITLKDNQHICTSFF